MDIEKKISELQKAITLKELGADGIYYFVASKQVRDRDNDLIYCGSSDKGQGILTDEFDKNPVFLKCHDDKDYPIGKVVSHVTTMDSSGIPQLIIGVQFAETEDGAEAEYLYKNGFMSAVSIRFRPTEYVYNEFEQGFDVYTSKLYEVSAVSIPANQEALIIKGYKAQKKLEQYEKKEPMEAVIAKLENLKKAFIVDDKKALNNSLTIANTILTDLRKHRGV